MSITESIIEKKTLDEIYLENDDPWDQNKILNKYPQKMDLIKFLVIFCRDNFNCKKILELGSGLGFITNEINKIKDMHCTCANTSKICIPKASDKYGDNFIILDLLKKDHLDIITSLNPDIILMLDVTWYILDNINEIHNYFKENFKGKILIHILNIPNNQKYGQEYFTNLNEILDFFDMEYIYSGTIHQKDNTKTTFFVAKIN